MNIKTSRIVFWLLLRICATQELVDQVREEIAPFAIATQAVGHFPIAELPQLRLDMKRLEGSCPLLKYCYYECLRLDSAPVRIESLRQDIRLVTTASAMKPDEQSVTYLLNVGLFIAIPLNACLNDPRYVSRSHSFEPSRFFVPNENGRRVLTADAGTQKVFGDAHELLNGIS